MRGGDWGCGDRRETNARSCTENLEEVLGLIAGLCETARGMGVAQPSDRDYWSLECVGAPWGRTVPEGPRLTIVPCKSKNLSRFLESPGRSQETRRAWCS